MDPTEPALHRLEAERLRPSRDETPADPWMELIAALDGLLSDPPPPDPVGLSVPGLPDQTKIAEEGT